MFECIEFYTFISLKNIWSLAYVRVSVWYVRVVNPWLRKKNRTHENDVSRNLSHKNVESQHEVSSIVSLKNMVALNAKIPYYNY